MPRLSFMNPLIYFLQSATYIYTIGVSEGSLYASQIFAYFDFSIGTGLAYFDIASILQPNAVEYGPYDYTRGGNPTRDALERS